MTNSWGKWGPTALSGEREHLLLARVQLEAIGDPAALHHLARSAADGPWRARRHLPVEPAGDGAQPRPRGMPSRSRRPRRGSHRRVGGYLRRRASRWSAWRRALGISDRSRIESMSASWVDRRPAGRGRERVDVAGEPTVWAERLCARTSRASTRRRPARPARHRVSRGSTTGSSRGAARTSSPPLPPRRARRSPGPADRPDRPRRAQSRPAPPSGTRGDRSAARDLSGEGAVARMRSPGSRSSRASGLRTTRTRRPPSVEVTVEGGFRGARSHSAPDFSEVFAWLRDNQASVIASSPSSPSVLIAFSLLAMWLSARGTMMALRAIALDHSRLGEHWKETRDAAWAYFGFRMILAAISLPIVLGTVVWAVYDFIAVYRGGASDFMGSTTSGRLLPPILVLLVTSLLFAPINFLGRNLLAPMLLIFRDGLRANWSRTMNVVRTSFGGVLLFLLVRMLIAVVQGIGETIAVYVTCCIGGLPVIHQVVAAPFTAFERAYTLARPGVAGTRVQAHRRRAALAAIPQPPYGQPPGLPAAVSGAVLTRRRGPSSEVLREPRAGVRVLVVRGHALVPRRVVELHGVDVRVERVEHDAPEARARSPPSRAPRGAPAVAVPSRLRGDEHPLDSRRRPAPRCGSRRWPRARHPVGDDEPAARRIHVLRGRLPRHVEAEALTDLAVVFGQQPARVRVGRRHATKRSGAALSPTGPA